MLKYRLQKTAEVSIFWPQQHTHTKTVEKWQNVENENFSIERNSVEIEEGKDGESETCLAYGINERA